MSFGLVLEARKSIAKSKSKWGLSLDLNPASSTSPTAQVTLIWKKYPNSLRKTCYPPTATFLTFSQRFTFGLVTNQTNSSSTAHTRRQLNILRLSLTAVISQKFTSLMFSVVKSLHSSAFNFPTGPMRLPRDGPTILLKCSRLKQKLMLS